MNDLMEEQSSFGIKKIVDCMIGEGGQQLYKVKWQETWEPAENLASCQNLIDEFWSFINIAKAREKVAQQHRTQLEQNKNNRMNMDQNFHRLTEDSKAEVQQLISRANATSVGNQMLMSPSNTLTASLQQNQQNTLLPTARTPTHTNNHNLTNSPQTFGSSHNSFGAGGGAQQNVNSIGLKGKIGAFGNKSVPTPSVKIDAKNSDKCTSESTPNSKISNQASLKYLESFSNPYVKVIIVCKICNKEASKFSRNWKPHYLTHVSSEEKPHQCSLCPAGFVSLTALRKHEEKKHRNVYAGKSEYHVKEETY